MKLLFEISKVTNWLSPSTVYLSKAVFQNVYLPTKLSFFQNRCFSFKVARYLIILLLMTLLTFILTLTILITSGRLRWRKSRADFLKPGEFKNQSNFQLNFPPNQQSNRLSNQNPDQNNLSEKQELFLEKLQSFQKYLQNTGFSRENTCTFQSTRGYHDLENGMDLDSSGSTMKCEESDQAFGIGFEDGLNNISDGDTAVSRAARSLGRNSIYWEDRNFSVDRIGYPKTSLV